MKRAEGSDGQRASAVEGRECEGEGRGRDCWGRLESLVEILLA